MISCTLLGCLDHYATNVDSCYCFNTVYIHQVKHWLVLDVLLWPLCVPCAGRRLVSEAVDVTCQGLHQDWHTDSDRIGQAGMWCLTTTWLLVTVTGRT